MNTPLILMTAALVVAIICWLESRATGAFWRKRYHDSVAGRERMFRDYSEALDKLFVFEYDERKRAKQRVAALDKAHAANRAKRATP